MQHVRRRAGFTIVELLISIAIIFVLITAAAVALKAARKAANRTQTSSALRQITAAHAAYSAEYQGRLLPGYIKPEMLDPTGSDPDKLYLKAQLPNGPTLSAADTSSYVWRLAPFLDNAWRTYMTDYRSPSLESRLAREYGDGSGPGVFGPGTYNADAAVPDLGIGICTSIGLNSIYVGGDSFHGPGNCPTYSPWSASNANLPNPKRIAAVRVAEVKNPSKIIVFAPTKRHYPLAHPKTAVDSTSDVLGYVELRPPWAPGDDNPALCGNQQWRRNEENQLVPHPAGWLNGAGGLMHDRTSVDQVPLSHLDGSVEIRNPSEFFVDPRLSGDAVQRAVNAVMSHWVPDAGILAVQ